MYTRPQNLGLLSKRFSLGRIELRKVISFVILILFSVWIVLYVRSHISEFSNIFNLSLRVVAIISVLLLIDSVILGLFNKVLMQDFDISLKFKEWYGLSIISNLWNYILPFQGGAGVRAIYLKKVYNFTVSNFFATMLALYFIGFFVNSLIGLMCLLYIYIYHHVLNIVILLFFSAVFTGVCIVMLFSPQVPEFKSRLLRKIGEVINAWYVIRVNRTLVINLILVIIFHAVVELLTVHFSFRAYGINLSLYKCLLITALLEFSVLIKITPGSLGVTEGIIVFGAQIFNITPAQSLLAAGLMRVINLFWIFSLGPIFSYLLSLDIRMRNSTSP